MIRSNRKETPPCTKATELMQDVLNDSKVTRFETTTNGWPTINHQSYCVRIFRYFNSEWNVFVISFWYLYRVIRKTRTNMTNESYYRYILVCNVIAHKFWCDDHFSNAYYSIVGAVDVPDLNQLEQKILALLDYRLYIKAKTFSQWEKKIKIYLK